MEKKIQPKFQKSLFGKWVSVISGKKSRLFSWIYGHEILKKIFFWKWIRIWISGKSGWSLTGPRSSSSMNYGGNDFLGRTGTSSLERLIQIIQSNPSMGSKAFIIHKLQRISNAALKTVIVILIVFGHVEVYFVIILFCKILIFSSNFFDDPHPYCQNYHKNWYLFNLNHSK